MAIPHLTGKVSVLIALALLSNIAFAEFYDRGRYITDPVSGLDWIKLDETLGRTYAQVAAGAGGFLEDDWRIAQAHELEDLLGRVTQIPSDAQVPSPNLDATLDFIQCLGATIYFNIEGVRPVRFTDDGLPVQLSSIATYDDLDGDRVGLASVMVRFADSDPDLSGTVRWVVLKDFWIASEYGHQLAVFLVRETRDLSRGPKCGRGNRQ
jgi:hypothetical protein